MKIAFIHYHLKPGGVTRVIQQQVAICGQLGWQYCILAGDNPLNMPKVVIIPELRYDIHRSDPSSPQSAVLLAENMERGIRSLFQDLSSTDSADIIHVHNATLAKNSDLLPAIHVLAERGRNIFLQIHDFAEDGRPSVYSAADYLASIHYGCINSRDRSYLSRIGLPAAQLHSIPNLVSPLPGAVPPAKHAQSKPVGTLLQSKPPQRGRKLKNRRFALYPVRGIRRKNIGEIVLLSQLIDNIDFGITLEPNNVVDMPSYHFWESLVAEIHAPIEFNIADSRGFEAALAMTDFFISTSVQEGFGFTFLEPWTVKKCVAGRLIPHLWKDFTEAGVKMEWFYTGIPIPVDEIDMDSFCHCWLTEARDRFNRFAAVLKHQKLYQAAERVRRDAEKLEDCFTELYGSRYEVDFGRLDLKNQARVIRRAAASPQFAEGIRNSVPQLLACPFSSCTATDMAMVEHNHQQVYKIYGNKQYQQRMQNIYESIMKYVEKERMPVGGCLDKEVLLQAFLDPANIFLVTSS